jgi:sporulation protein YlmC with PRC-barrel domain
VTSRPTGFADALHMAHSRRMLRLTIETGQEVHTADARRLGRVLDLAIRIDAAHPQVDALAVGARRIDHLVPWHDVASFEHTVVHLRPGAEPIAGAGGAVPLADDQLLLVRDVLDTQIVDVAGRRVQRVGDVLLARTDDGHLEAVAVDVGIAPVLRRLGLRGAADRMREQAVDWRDLHLTSARGHAIQLSGTSAAVHRLDERELAHLIALLSTGHAAAVIATVPPDRAAAALDASHPEVGARVALALNDRTAAQVLEELPHETRHRLRGLRRDRAVRRRFERGRGWRRFLPPPHEHGVAP